VTEVDNVFVSLNDKGKGARSAQGSVVDVDDGVISDGGGGTTDGVMMTS
jgi:hypothetical protein